MRPDAYTLPLVPETIFRDGNAGKSNSPKVEVQGPSVAPGGGQRASCPEAESFF